MHSPLCINITLKILIASKIAPQIKDFMPSWAFCCTPLHSMFCHSTKSITLLTSPSKWGDLFFTYISSGEGRVTQHIQSFHFSFRESIIHLLIQGENIHIPSISFRERERGVILYYFIPRVGVIY